MDRRGDRIRELIRDSGFPRPRGDGPEIRSALLIGVSYRVSPPTRGWTLQPDCNERPAAI